MRTNFYFSKSREQKENNDVQVIKTLKLKRLDIGCWEYKRNGYIGVDILNVPNVDVQADVCNLPFKDSSIDEVYSKYSLEHVEDNIAAISEIWRVCKSGALIRLILPHFSNPAYYDDLTHKHAYSTRSFDYYDQELHEISKFPIYLPQVNLKVFKVELRWWPYNLIDMKIGWKRILLKILNSIFNYLADANRFLCERLWCNWVGGFYEVEFKLRVKKQINRNQQ